jgi:hypothetical protein
MLVINKQFKQVDISEKNWPNDPKVDYNSFFNLMKLIEKDLELEKKLK